jgi:hypothetical protein
MGRTAGTEPQSLYKGALYLYFLEMKIFDTPQWQKPVLLTGEEVRWVQSTFVMQTLDLGLSILERVSFT